MHSLCIRSCCFRQVYKTTDEIILKILSSDSGCLCLVSTKELTLNQVKCLNSCYVVT